MSRHRNIRSMNYSDEYDGYDDVYGHSVEDDYCISPSDAAFIYDREGSRGQQKIGVFFKSDDDILEEDENDDIEQETTLDDVDKAKLLSCIENIKLVIGNVKITDTELRNLIIKHKFEVEKIIDIILSSIRLVQPSQNPTQIDSKAELPKEKASNSDQNEPANIKIVAPASKTLNIVKGFDLQQQTSKYQSSSTPSLCITPRSQSPQSRCESPTNMIDNKIDNKVDDDVKMKEKRENALALYKKERLESKQHLYMVVIGHVDAGKSTLMGHLLCSLGQVNQRTMHKYEQESRKVGKQSFMYAWVLDETGEERNRGITMDVGKSQFETNTKLVTLLDAPGHKDFIPNMISGAGQADVALLVVDATRGEFESGFDLGGQTREHALLVRSLGVAQLAVVINKLDTVNWSQQRFDEIRLKLGAFLKLAGFRESDVTYVPCSGLTGENLVEGGKEDELVEWYKGPCLIEVIDNFRSPERPITKPFRLTINDIFKGTGSGFCVSGRIETGSLSTGDRVLLCPTREQATVKAISMENADSCPVGFAGDQVLVTLSGIEQQNVNIGNILCDPHKPVQISAKFEARIVVFNVKVPITKGFPVIMHHQSLVEPVVITKLLAQLHKNNGEVIKNRPRCLGNNSSATIEITASRPLALELYSECKELGRIMLRVSGVTIAAGLITRIIL